MNTMPQALETHPASQSRRPLPGFRGARGRSDSGLRLVVDRPELLEAAQAYGLNGRRHLASVPKAPVRPQAAAAGADNPGMAASWTPRRLEPLAFALVLLVSVAALAVALRAG